MNIHFLQSPAWQTFQESLGRTTIREQGDGWEFLAILESSAGIKRLYCPYGPVIESIDALTPALEALRRQAAQHGAAYVRIQPTGITPTKDQLMAQNLKPITYSQPSHTWLLDLSDDRDTLLANMKQNTRNICRNYQKKGLHYETSTDPATITHLTSLLHDTAVKNHITVHSDDYLRHQADSLLPINAASIHLMYLESEVIAAALVYEDATTSYYAHAASSFTYRNLGASTALLGEIIMNAKQNGKTTFDFYGIAPTNDPAHRWAGFTAFKKSFGGYEHLYAETYELPVRPLLYRGYRLLRRLR